MKYLAHHGVLFLDELPEFPRRSRSAGESYETGQITIFPGGSSA